MELGKTFCLLTYVALNQWNYFIHVRSRSVGLQSPSAVSVPGIACTYTQQYAISVLWAVQLEAVIIMPPMNIGDTIHVGSSQPVPVLHGYHTVSACQMDLSSG